MRSRAKSDGDLSDDDSLASSLEPFCSRRESLNGNDRSETPSGTSRYLEE
jgi:hypothetical protein